MDMKVAMKYENKYQLGTEPLPTEDCISPDYFLKERELVFKRSWLFAARVEELPDAGSYLVQDIDVLQTSIILTKNKEHQIKAFHNACPHRINKIMPPGTGKVKAFTCQFHGWSFDLDGQLIHSSNENLFQDFKKKEMGLIPVHAEVWNGFIFINVASRPQNSLRESLGEFASQFDGYFDKGNMSLRQKWHTDINANWKLVLDSQTEAYHAPTLHAKTLRDAAAGKDNPDCHFNDVRLFGKHRSMGVYGNPDYQPTMVEAKAAGYAKTPLYPATSAMAAALPPGINSTRNPRWIFDIMVLFPNLLIAPANGWYGIMLFWPISFNKTRFEFRQYIYSPETAGDIVAQEYGLVHGRDVIREDLSTMEGTQQMMESGFLKKINLCDEEITVRHNHWAVEQAIKEEGLR